jgi:predicted enzyme related to lactoylglutathione lyase/ketosteroid isomerase-like protein
MTSTAVQRARRHGALAVTALSVCLVPGVLVAQGQGQVVEADTLRMDHVTGVGGIFLKASDPATLLAWYRRHLGIPAGAGAYHMFSSRDMAEPERVDHTIWAVHRADDESYGAGKTFMVNFRVADLDALLARLREEGAHVDDDIEEYPFGRFGWVRDPEGNRIELWEPSGSGAAGGARSVEQAVLAAQEELIRAELAGDVAALGRLIADDFWGMDTSNGPFTRATILEGYESGGVTVESNEVDDVAVRVMGGVVVTVGRAAIRGRTGGEPFASHMRFMDVWALRDGAWRLIAAHVVPEPATP